MQINNEKLVAQLTLLDATANNIAAAAKANDINLPTLAATFAKQNNELKTLLSECKIVNITYEFCEAAANLIEAITDLRLTEGSLRQLLNETQLFTAANECVAAIKTALYQHEMLINQKPPLLPSGNTLEAATARAEAAAKHAAESSALAEKASQQGVRQLGDLQELQKRGGDIDPALFDQSVQHTLAMYAKNTAAVIAADEAAAAITELEEMIKQAEGKA